MHTVKGAVNALYNGHKVTLCNPYNGKIFSITREKLGHTLPSVWVWEEDGQLSTEVNSGHNGMLLSRQDLLQWVSDCTIVSID